MLLLALDQGTTSSRSILFTPTGRARSTAQKEFTQIFPTPVHVEYVVDEIGRTQRGTARRAIPSSSLQQSPM